MPRQPIAEARQLDFPPITRVVLTEAEGRVAAGLSHDPRVPFYRTLHRKLVRDFL